MTQTHTHTLSAATLSYTLSCPHCTRCLCIMWRTVTPIRTLSRSGTRTDTHVTVAKQGDRRKVSCQMFSENISSSLGTPGRQDRSCMRDNAQVTGSSGIIVCSLAMHAVALLSIRGVGAFHVSVCVRVRAWYAKCVCLCLCVYLSACKCVVFKICINVRVFECVCIYVSLYVWLCWSQ